MLLYVHHLIKRNIMKMPPGFFVALITSWCISCTPAKQTRLTIPVLESKPVKFIPLRELLVNRGHYSGHLIETEGLSAFGFERSGLYYDSLLQTIDGTIQFTCYGDALWLEMHPAHPFYFHMPDSLNDKKIRVRGILDTTDHGHTGMYTATLRDIYYIQAEKKK